MPAHTSSCERSRQVAEGGGVYWLVRDPATVLDYVLPFDAESFDHVFVCFVLEHLADPVAALARLRRLLRPGGRSP